MRTIRPTVTEKEALARQGVENVEEVHVCHPCWKVVKDPEHGLQLLRGLVEQNLRAMNIPNATEMADAYLEKIRKKVGHRGMP